MEVLMFGRAASNEIVEAKSKLLMHIGEANLDQKSFDACYEKFGGAWSEERKPLVWNFLLNVCKGFDKILGTKQATNHLKPWRVFGFITGSLEVNGLATRLFDPKFQAYYLGITAGSLLTPYLTHARLASQEAYFPEIPAIGPVSRFALETDEQIDLPASRLAMATGLSIVSAYAVFFHELAHILRGHIAKINAAGATEAPLLLEADSFSMVGLPDLDRRSIETDADYYAGVWLAEFFLSGRIPLPQLGRDISERLPRISMAVLAAYYKFPQSTKYHDGMSRVYVVLAGLMSRLDVPTKAKSLAKVAVPMIDEFIGILKNAGLQVGTFDLDDLAALIETTEPTLRRLEPGFVAERPEKWRR